MHRIVPIPEGWLEIWSIRVTMDSRVLCVQVLLCEIKEVLMIAHASPRISNICISKNLKFCSFRMEVLNWFLKFVHTGTLCCTDTATLKWTRHADTWHILKTHTIWLLTLWASYIYMTHVVVCAWHWTGSFQGWLDPAAGLWHISSPGLHSRVPSGFEILTWEMGVSRQTSQKAMEGRISVVNTKY